MAVITALYRFPVKSMLGEALDTVQLSEQGIPGDRAWAVRDEKFGGIKGAKRFPLLMRCQARFLEAPTAGQRSAPAEITLPDGTTFSTMDVDINERLSAFLGRQVSFWPLLPATAKEHYKRGAPEGDDPMAEIRHIFGRREGEPLPDLSQFPPELFEYTSPLGTYFDAFPTLVLSQATLDRLQALAPSSAIDVRRFRPNILVDEGEDDWVGREIEIGSARLKVEMPCPRCTMTTMACGDLPDDDNVLRTLIDHTNGNLGVYASVSRPGECAVGDTIKVT